jgi:hypothetical protein
MSKLSTLNYLINSYQAGKKEVEILQYNFKECDATDDLFDFEPSESCINSILSFASQFEVLKSTTAGNIELNLN